MTVDVVIRDLLGTPMALQSALLVLFGALAVIALARPLRSLLRAVLWPGVGAVMAHDPSSSAPLAPLSLSWPIVGMLPTVLSSNRMQGFFRLASKGRTYRGYVVGMGAFHNLSGGEGLRVLDSEHPASKWPEAMERIFGPGSLLTTNGAEWRRLRKLLGSAMTPWQLAASLPDIVGAVRDALTRWARESAEAAAMGSKPPLGAPRIKCMALDILLRAIVGMTVDVEEVERIAVVLKDVAAGILMPTEWYMPGHGLFAKAMNRSEEIRECFRPYLEHARRAATQGELSGDQAAKQEGGLEDQALPRSKSVRLDMRSSSLLYRLAACRDEEGRPLSDAACMDNLLVFLFAGHETTASATSNLLPMLAHHPRWEERLRQEQRALMAQYGEDITMEVLGKMEVADAVVREVLRIFPPAAAGAYRIADRTFESDGYQVPAKHLVSPDYVTTHIFDRGCWVDPSRISMEHMDPVKGFRPERWLGEGGFKKPGIDYVPFGVGAQSCIGTTLAYTEMKAFLAVAFRDFRIRVADTSLTLRGPWPLPEMASGVPFWVERIPTDGRAGG